MLTVDQMKHRLQNRIIFNEFVGNAEAVIEAKEYLTILEDKGSLPKIYYRDCFPYKVRTKEDDEEQNTIDDCDFEEDEQEDIDD